MIEKNIKTMAILGIAITIIESLIALYFSVVAMVIILVLSLALTGLFMFFTLRRYRKLEELNSYLSLVCSGNYTLDINENTEGELSILKNNLYKVIVLLRSQNERLVKDKMFLADTLADISHQVKTPLTSIMVMTDLLQQTTDEKQKQEFLTIIDNQLKKMKWLIENLLKLSKLDADTVTFKKERHLVSSLVSSSIEPFLVVMDLKNIKLSTDISDFDFVGDIAWTREAIENIIKNCIEHTGEGGELKIEAKISTIDKYIRIRDNGCGIKKKDLPHIFERFYHGENSNKESVGIGLALSKAILEKQGFRIEVESEENKGTEFTIKLIHSIV